MAERRIVIGGGVVKPTKAQREAEKKRTGGSVAGKFAGRSRPAPRAALFERYGLVFDPARENDPVTKAEQDALLELYRSQTGREADQEPDLRVALSQAGLLRAPGGGRLRKRGEPPVFASAMDAIDWERASGDVAESLLFGGARALFEMREGGALEPTSRPIVETVFATPGLDALRQLGRLPMAGDQPGTRGPETIGESFRGSARALGRIASAPAGPIADVGRAIWNAPVAVDEPGARRWSGPGQPRRETIGEAVGGTAGALRDIGIGAVGLGVRGLAAGISPLRSPFPTAGGVRVAAAGPRALRETPGLETTQTLGDVNETFLDMSSNPNQYVDASSRFKDPIPNAPQELTTAMAASMAGAPAGQLGVYADLAREQLRESPFAPEVDASMKNRARLNGFDVAGWGQLPLEEKIFQATNENNSMKLLGRSLVRSLGEAGATPAGFKAVAEATLQSAGGDTDEARAIIASVAAPYGFAWDQRNREGFWPALFVFGRDNPVELALILNAAAGGSSKAGGIAARAGIAGARAQRFAQPGRRVTVRGEPVTVIRETLEEPDAAPVFRDAETGDVVPRVASEVPDSQRVLGEVTTEQVYPEVTVGFTGRGLAGNAWLQFVASVLGSQKKIFAERRKLTIEGMARRSAQRETRLQGNVVQNVKIEIANILSEALGRAPSEALKQRVAWNLTRPAVMFDRTTAYTPAVEAAFYRQQVADLEARRAAEGQRLDVADNQQITLWNQAADFLDQIERVDVDPVVMSRVRDAARPLGRQNDVLVAEALLTTPKAARRANYIRLVVLDPQFEVSAKGLKRRRNRGIVRLVKTQRNVQRLSREILRYGDETGWGKYGQTRSRDAFENARAKLMKELRRGIVLALRAGDNEMAARFNDALDQLSGAKLGGNERRVRAEEAVAALERMDLPEERLAELPESGRAAYERAAFAARREEEQRGVVGAVEAERAGVLEGIGMRRVTEREVGLQRQRVEDLRNETSFERSLSPGWQQRLNDAEAKLVEMERALEMSGRVRAEKLTLKQRAQIAKYARREAEKALRSGDTVLDAQEVRAALDVSERFAVVQIKTKREFDYYTMDRARAETLDQFIARVEATDQQAVLHLVQTPDFERIGRPITVSGDRMLNLTPTAGGFVRPGRFKETQGYLFATAQESAKMWQNLLFDTAELVAAAGWRKKIQELVEATSIPFEFTEATLREAQRRVDDGEVVDFTDANGNVITAQQQALEDIIRAQGVEYDITNIVVVNPLAPRALKPSERISLGVTREVDDVPLSSLVMRELNDRTIDVNAPGRYYLMPRSTWDGIQKAIEDESFRIRPKANTRAGGFVYAADRVARAWRTLTLNVLPRTAINNFIGSTILAIQAGAGPRAFYYAAKALRGSEVGPDGRRLPIPAELRQRYFEQETARIGQTKRKPGDISEPSLREATYSWIGWYMNSLRKINGMSEDFGRLAVWYSKAYPYAIKESTGSRLFMERAKRLNDGAVDLLDAMARRDPRFLQLHEEWMRLSFDFLGDLHRGGPIASALRIAIPFYQWYAHMLKLTLFTMPFKYPKRTLFLQQLAEIGAMYQQQQGSLVPYGEDFLPWYKEMTEVDGMPQEVAIGVSTGGWYPQTTVGEFGSRAGDLNTAPGALYKYVNPTISNSSLILLAFISAINGNPVEEIDTNGIFKAAKDEYGLEIDDVTSRQFYKFLFNKFFRMVPLSPTLMSQSGRASTAVPFPGMMDEKDYNSLRLPGEYQQQQRSDIAGLVDDPGANIFGFMYKIFGAPVTAYPGYGPVWRERLMRDYEYAIDEKSREDAAIRDSIMEIHNQSTTTK